MRWVPFTSENVTYHHQCGLLLVAEFATNILKMTVFIFTPLQVMGHNST